MLRLYIKTINNVIKNKNKSQLKSILKLNNLLILSLKNVQTGGANKDKEKLLELIEPLKQKIQDIQNSNLKIDELVNSKIELNKLLEFIHYIHSKLPNDKNFLILSNQIDEINNIVHKYD